MNHRAKRIEKDSQKIINTSSSTGYKVVSFGSSDNAESVDNDSSSSFSFETKNLLSPESLIDLNLSKEAGDIDCITCSPSNTSFYPESDT
jgi:hypothetical protein